MALHLLHDVVREKTVTSFIEGMRERELPLSVFHFVFLSVPLLVRPGAVIPVGAVADRPDYDHADGATLRAYRLERGAQVTVPVGDVTFTVVREGDTLRASGGDLAAGWSLAAGERTARAAAGTGFLSLELGRW